MVNWYGVIDIRGPRLLRLGGLTETSNAAFDVEDGDKKDEKVKVDAEIRGRGDIMQLEPERGQCPPSHALKLSSDLLSADN